MSTSFQRVRQGAISLGIVFVFAVLGYHFVGGYSWLDAVWMVVITISTVGFGERSELPVELQLLTMGVILLGVSASAYTFGSLIQYLLEGEFDRVLGTRKMNKEISKLSGHVVVCGFGRIGEDLVRMLKSRGVAFVVIDNDTERTDELRDMKALYVNGDATAEPVLEEANVTAARALVTTLPTDAENVFIALTARNMCPDIQIISTAEFATSCKKLRQAGANKIVMPHRVGAQTVERMLSRPTTADLFDLFAEATELEMELDEYQIPADSPLSGKTLGASGIRERFDLLVVGVKKKAGELTFNPPSNHVIEAEDTVMLIGKFENIERLKQL